MPAPELMSWSTRAVNLPEHGDNPIHTDAGARAAGYARAIVAGTSVYAYLTHPPAVAWGMDWIGRGGGELRLLAPVFDDDLVACEADIDDGRPRVLAQVGGDTKASFVVDREAAPLPVRSGEDLPALDLVLDERWADYGLRSGDDLSLYQEQGVVHPAAWPCIANRVFSLHLIDGAWIHTRSRIVHRGAATAGAPAVVASTVVDRFETRAGERAVVDVRVFVDGAVVAEIEHEALVRLNQG